MEMNSKIRSLTRNNHDNMVKKQLEMFMKSSVLADCTLSAEGQHLKAHKIILAACSHYFETLFRQDNMNNFVIVLKDVKLCNLKALLHFMYCGEVVVSQDHLKDFIDTAKSLQVRGLEDEYKKFDLRRTPKKSRLDIISTTHDPNPTSMVQMKTNYSDLSDIDETTLTVGISRLSVNSDNYSPFHIQNTTIPIHSFPTLTTFDLNNIKFSQIRVPEIKSEVQCECRIQKPVNKNMVQSPTSDLLEKITMLDNNIEITKEISKDLKIQQTTLSSEPETCEKQHHKSVQTQERNTSKPNTRKHKKARDVPIERKLLDLTTSVNANNNKNDNNSVSSSLSQSQTLTTCRRSSCNRASRKPEKLNIHEKIHKSRYENLFCENCKKTFLPTPNFKNHHCSTYESKQSYFNIHEQETFKRPTNKSHQYVCRGMQPFFCQFCPTEFRNIRQLQSHINEHRRLKQRNSMPFMCQYCQRSFMNIKHLQCHLNKHKRKRFLFQEWAMKHGQSNLPFLNHDPVFECSICRKAFTKKVYLHEHQYFHDRK